MKLHKIIGNVISVGPEERADLLEAYAFFDFIGDDLTIIEVIRSIHHDFDFLDLAMKFKPEDRARLISLCMEAYINRSKKEIVDNMRKTKDIEYINVFK